MLDLALLLMLAQAPAPPAVAPASDDAGPPPIEPRVVDEPTAGDVTGGGGATADAGTSALDIIVTARVEPDPVTFGEPFSLVVSIVRDRGVRVELPGSIPEVDAAPRTGDPVRGVEEAVGPTGAPAGGSSALAPAPASAPDAGSPRAPRVRETIRIPFLALDTEDLKTPAFALTAPDGTALEVPALNVRVVVPPEEEPADGGPARDPVQDPAQDPARPGQVLLEPAAPVIAYAVPDERPWIVLGGLAGAGVLVALARLVNRWRRARRPAVPAVPPPPPRPAHEVALERLEALLQSGLLQRGETAIFVERLMDEVLRDYLTARFALSAGTRTTRELVKDLLGVAVVGLDVALVEGLLADADLVKFAKASIAGEQAHAMATRVRALIEQTREQSRAPTREGGVADHAPSTRGA